MDSDMNKEAPQETAENQPESDRASAEDENPSPEEMENGSCTNSALDAGADKTAEPSTEEDCDSHLGSKQVRMQSLFTQVRKQIRAQAGIELHRKGILDVVQRATQRELEKSKEGESEQMSQGTSLEEGSEEALPEDGGTEKVGVEGQGEVAGLTALRDELLVSMEVLRTEFKSEIAELRLELKAYCKCAVKNLEPQASAHKTDPWKSVLHKMTQPAKPPQPSNKNLDDKRKSLSVPSLLPGRARVLTRTMTTITPHTALPASMGPRSKSETLDISREKYSNSLLLLESQDFHVLASHSTTLCKGSGTLPPAVASLRGNNKRLSRSKARLGNSATKYP